MPSRRELEFARLEQLLREADERAERERRRAEEADVRAEQERRRTEDEQRNRIEEETKTRPTTFEEYLRACHTLLSTSYPDRQEPQHTGLHHQPQEQALPDLVKLLAIISTTSVYIYLRRSNIYFLRE
jgi:hypothetical protein